MKEQQKDTLFAQMLHDTLETTELAYQFQSRLGPDALDWLEIVTAKKDTQVDKLRHLHLESLERELKVNFAYRFLLRL